jgi:integrase
VQRFYKERNADGLIMLGQKKLADRLLGKNLEQTKGRAFEATFKEYLEDFKADSRPSDGYVQLIERYYLKQFKSAWRRVADLTEDSIRQYKAKRAVKPNTLHKELIVLRLFVRWCASKGYLARPPEFTLPSGKSTFKSRPPTRAEVELILARLPDSATAYAVNKQRRPVREFFTFLYFQALRWGTVEKAEWSDIFIKDSRWYFRIRAEIDKARFDRVVPMHKRSVAALQSVGVKDSGLIFGARDYRNILSTVLDELKLRHIRMHDFRHARIDELVQKTLDLSGVQFLAGHRDLKTTQHYMHPDTKRVERIFEDEER